MWSTEYSIVHLLRSAMNVTSHGSHCIASRPHFLDFDPANCRGSSAPARVAHPSRLALPRTAVCTADQGAPGTRRLNDCQSHSVCYVSRSHANVTLCCAALVDQGDTLA